VVVIGNPKGVYCDELVCRFERGVSEAVDSLGCWEYVRSTLADALRVARYEPAVTEGKRILRAVRVKMTGWKRYRTYVCIDDLLDYVASVSTSPRIDLYPGKLFNFLRLIRIVHGVSREKKWKMWSAAVEFYNKLLSILSEN